MNTTVFEYNDDFDGKFSTVPSVSAAGDFIGTPLLAASMHFLKFIPNFKFYSFINWWYSV